MKKVHVGREWFTTRDEGQGPVLLLVHGFPLNHSMWNRQIEWFSKSLRVVAPDLRGFGASPEAGETSTMEQFAQDLVGLLEALKIEGPIVYCGLSMGGYIGWRFARDYPDRVRALIQCDTRALADSPDAAAGRRKLADQTLSQGPGPIADAMLPKLAAGEHAAVMAELRRMIMATSSKGIAAALRGMASRPDMTDFLPKITAPTLTLVGERDVISTPAETRGIAAAIPGAKYVEIPGAGHMTPMENPTAFNREVEIFLGEVGVLA